MRAGCFTLIIFMMYCCCQYSISVSLPHSVMCWPAVCTINSENFREGLVFAKFRICKISRFTVILTFSGNTHVLFEHKLKMFVCNFYSQQGHHLEFIFTRYGKGKVCQTMKLYFRQSLVFLLSSYLSAHVLRHPILLTTQTMI